MHSVPQSTYCVATIYLEKSGYWFKDGMSTYLEGPQSACLVARVDG